ncbi:THUMP domain-containing class I SAM-dependent RNA methyltransferase [Pararhodobacter oceanensis]|uniref:RNA methyltransferase n=1 Tax=Pararhodobacter oceanensis TaxID=2172121 RepID=A0A2T8HSB2_9RHOB|nr:class I SAM-dependent RNA methyltransferase [Pararhodobacter oceanensis]PVH28202.1 RNA methyltransferase [Pararhodobacter oceanensis]
MSTEFSIFLVCPPGTESLLAAEASAAGFTPATAVPGGVEVTGGWREVWRANLTLRGATRVLLRFAEFRALHLAQLDKRARRLPWGEVLRADVPVKIEATCRKSRIYHAKAATQRVETAITESIGAPISAEAALVIKTRIEDDLVTLSLDTSGEPLHRRGHKQAVGKAPMRENLAAIFLRQMGYDGTQTLVDPMCGSGTFPIEAAEIALGLLPGRSRSFAFEGLASFDQTAFEALKSTTPKTPNIRFYGSDRDQGAVQMAVKNAARAGVAEYCTFERKPISDLTPPEGAKGIVMVNPPWGARIGDRKMLFALYGSLGKTLSERFKGWQVGIITPDAGLVKATALGLKPADTPVDMGGVRVTLYRGTAG